MTWILIVSVGVIGFLLGTRYQFFAVLAASVLMIVTAALAAVIFDQPLGPQLFVTFGLLVELQFCYFAGLLFTSLRPRCSQLCFNRSPNS